MKGQILFIVACTFSTITTSLLAQPANREIVNQSIEWAAITSNIIVSKKLTAIVEGQFRYARDFEPMQFQARTALEIKLNDHFSIVPVGYVYTWNHQYGKQPAIFENNEHRLWEQVSYAHSLGRIKFDHRLRLEQRFIQEHSVTNEGNLIDEGYGNKQNRLRYRFMARIPINNASLQPKTWFVALYDEAFLSWGKNVTFHEPDQNRIFGGLGYEFSKMITFQGGFFYQMQIKENGAKQENNVGFQIQLNYNLSLLKTE